MDPRTALAIATLFMLLNGGILGLMHRGLSTEVQSAAADWRIATLLAAGGTVLLAAQQADNIWLLLPTGNTSLQLAMTLYWRSVRRFDGLPDNPWIFGPAVVVSLTITWFAIVEPVLWCRVLAATVGWVSALSAAAWSLYRHRRNPVEISRRVLACILLAVAVFMLVRGTVFVWSQPVHGSILDTASWLNAITPLSAAVLPVIGTTAFLVLCSERLQAHLAQRALELDHKNSALNAAIRAREDAERIARHDLKTPLASIAATPALLRAIEPPNAEQEQLLGMVEHAANRALSMVKLSLDLYHMETGSYVFQPECVDVAGIATSVMQDLRAHAASKGVRLELQSPAEAVWVAADASLCYCCMANLLKNAVEAASDGSAVTVSVALGPRVRVAIHNRGVVPPALRERFFEKYATQGKLDGTGLGTYSSHLMALAQGGSLSMETSDAQGTTTLTLELQPFQGPATLAATPPTTSGLPVDATAAPGPAQPLGEMLRVLIADDDAYNRKVLRGQLPSSGVEVATAINGREAFERCLVAPPDVIFMDVEMPVQGGVEAMQHIRALQSVRRQTASLICAFSSDNDAHNQDRYLALGFDHCLVKPSSAERVAKLLHRASAVAQARTPVALAPKLTGPVQLERALLPDITAFLRSRLDLLAQLQAAAMANDHVRMRRLAHTLNGSFAMFGFVGAAEVCEHLERQGADLDAAVISAQLDQLVAHLCTVPIEALSPSTNDG